MAVQYPELLQEWGEVVAARLEAEGLAPDRAADIAFAAAEDIRKRWGGLSVYIPKAAFLELSERDVQIYADWRAGLGVPDMTILARKWDLTPQRLYFIIRQVRLARRQQTTEIPLPGFPLD